MLSSKLLTTGRRLLAPQSARSFASKDHFYQILQMDETRTDLNEMVQGFADAEVRPLAEEMDKTMKFPHHMWKRMGE
jgi:isovaleryl-CoA dehydrogenase